jgi:hypothetical protein
MGDKTSAFAKGGFGCLGGAIVIGILFVLLGGSFHIDLGGACCLFAVGGIIGLVVLAIYKSGKANAGE